MTETPWIIDVDTPGFERDVLERSLDVPVLLDFWAAWCGPCKTLGPLLEKLAGELQGRFVLAKVDVDANPRLADAFRIQSIPTVMLIVGGRPVDAFMGALPEAEIRAFLEPHLGPPEADALEQARELAAAGDGEAAVALLRAHLVDYPEHDEARVALAGLLADGEGVDEAASLLEGLPEELAAGPEVAAVRAKLDLRGHAGDVAALEADVLADPNDLGKRLELGRALVAAGRREEGLEAIWEAAVRDLHHDDDAPRKALLEVFKALGQQDPLTLEYQQRLSVLLCS